MSSEAASRQPMGGPAEGGWDRAETAPSTMRADEPALARWVGLTGLMFLTVGGIGLVAAFKQYGSILGPVLSSILFTFGFTCLLFHAARDSDMQVRRTYGVLAFLLAGAGALLSVLPIRGGAGTQFIPGGFLLLLASLLFLLPFLKHETAPAWRTRTLAVVGILGAGMTLTGFIGSNVNEAFVMPYGVLLTLLGLSYLWAFAGITGSGTELGYRAAMGLGAVGLVFLVIAAARSFIPPLLYALKWKATRPEPYFVPHGLLLGFIAILFVGLALALFSDNRFVILTRRELAAFFYSPIAYIVLGGMIMAACIIFVLFIIRIVPPVMMVGESLQRPEPIIVPYIFNFFLFLTLLLSVPLLTMRLLSEENRTGTLEVLFTAPVSETTVVLSKFMSGLIFFLVAWAPVGLYLIAFRLEMGKPFEYRPLLTLLLALICCGTAFISMGLFFSSLTRNQIVAAILTFAGMVIFTSVFLLQGYLQSLQRSAGANRELYASLSSFVELISYLTCLEESANGRFAPRQLVFQLSTGVFWLFATIKVLESRRWR